MRLPPSSSHRNFTVSPLSLTDSVIADNASGRSSASRVRRAFGRLVISAGSASCSYRPDHSWSSRYRGSPSRAAASSARFTPYRVGAAGRAMVGSSRSAGGAADFAGEPFVVGHARPNDVEARGPECFVGDVEIERLAELFGGVHPGA